MSIYATWLSLDEHHEEGCAVWVETSPSCFEFGEEPCDCGLPNAPLVYQGSHVLPDEKDRRGGSLDVAAIPSFIKRDGRDQGENQLWDWLRISVGSEDSDTMHEGAPYIQGGYATVVLNRPLVEALHETLGIWLEREPEGD